MKNTCLTAVATLVFVLQVSSSQARFFYAVQDDVLYRADPNSDTWTAMSDTWAGTELLRSVPAACMPSGSSNREDFFQVNEGSQSLSHPDSD
jgi:hypothetical protein